MRSAIVCGGRHYVASWRIAEVLSAAVQDYSIERIVHGAASGADTLAGEWAARNGLPVLAVPANWERDGRSAGPLRNNKMLSATDPVVVIAFPGGPGTAHMVRIAKAAGVPVVQVPQ